MFENDDPFDQPPADPAPTDPNTTPAERSSEDQEDFARMLEQAAEPRSYHEGETVEGIIVSLGTDVAFVDIGGKGEATIDMEELADPDSDVEVKVGDRVQAIVVSTTGGLKLSHRLARGAATRQRLNDAYRARLPVEGRIEKVIKGGFEVRIGGQRGFCPISQIDSRFTADPAVHEGQVYTFRIIEFKEGGKNIVVSRRAILEEEERERAEAARRAAVPDAVLPGKVVSVLPYGAFVDLGGGIQGLLHVSEMGWSRVSDPTEVVQVGDEITVKILRVDEEKGKISLGLKQLQADPWSELKDRFSVGQVLTGKVTRIADFGAFIELEPGIEALAHLSTFAPTGKKDGWKSATSPGDEITVRILSLDPERKRIGVAVQEDGTSQTDDGQDAGAGEHQDRKGGVSRSGKRRRPRESSAQEQPEAFGSLADKLRAALRPPKK